MERVRRRWWTTTVSVLALLVILAAAVSGLFQAAVLALPGYRDDLSDFVTRVAGRPVEIGGVALVWHGIYPRLDLSDITLYDEASDDEILSAQRLSLGFGLLRLVTGDFTPVRVELSGLSLSVSIDESGKFSIVGLDNAGQSTPPDIQKVLHELTRFRSLSLRNCQIELSAPRLPEKTLNLTLASAQLSQTLGGFGVEAELSLPAAYGKRIDFEADVDGALDQPADWSGGFNLSSPDLQPQPWIHRLVLPGTGAVLQGADLELRGSIHGGRVTGVETHLQADTAMISRAGQAVTNKDLDVLTQLVPVQDGWQLEVKRLRVDGEEQLRGSLRYAPRPEGGYGLDADIDLLRLDRLMPWLGYLHEPPRALAYAARASGEISGLVLRLQDAGDATTYSLHAAVKDASLRAGGPVVAGFGGVSGELVADEHSGRFALTPGALRLDLPHTFASAVDFDNVTAEARWSRRADGWQLQLPSFAWKVASIAGQGRMNLLLPEADDASPQLDLSAGFSVADVNQVKPYMPRFWGPHLRAWLTRAIVSARVSRAQLDIHGPLADFPYHQRHTGEWGLNLDLADARLAYLPDWPAVERLQARLRFAGNGLDVAADSGELLGNRIEQVHASFGDFHDAQLQIDATVAGEAARFYDFLQASPLRQTLAGLVDHTRASGPARVDVHLDVPLNDSQETEVNGKVALDGVDLRYLELNQPVRAIRGSLVFNRDGVVADRLSAKFADLDLAARILPRAGTHGVVAAGFDYAIKADGSGASAYVPEFVRKLVAGSSAHWLAELPLGSGGGLTLSSDLQGIAVPLPAPLGKRADESAPLSVTVAGATGDGATHVKVDYQQRLSADIAVIAEGDAQRTRGVSLFLGHDGTPAPAGEGLNINGNVDSLDLPAWIAVLNGSRDSGLPLRRAELHAAQLGYMGHEVRDVHAVLTPDAGGWVTQLDGAGAEGTLNWREAGAGKVEARLKHLAVAFHNSGLPASAPDKSADIFDPNRFPLLDLACDQFSVSGLDLGKLALVTQRVPGGQRIEHVALSGGKTSLDAEGWWKRDNALSSAALKFNLQSEESAAVLKAFGYTPTLDAKQSHFSGDLSWSPQPAGLAWEQARGRVGIEVRNGSLRSVEPGSTSRVLGLINIFALPRRLMLDFRDVVSSGLGFDKIDGNYDLADGNAVTNDLDVAGPSLHMEIRGRIGLVARDFDQKVTVHPDVSTGVSIGAALVGGPAFGALVLLAQQVLKQPIDKMTQLSYRVTGPWDNPKVE
ncbi:MAG: TIGR02099 family protein [Nevskiaceae bacterium]|nr:MAG: TIGR02099 family protein [Nevskiaceae bacterium]